jgi:hypothetical protein
MIKKKYALAYGSDRAWIPPKGRPFWINTGMPNVGPHLTDKRLRRFGLQHFIQYPFNKAWAESHRLARIKRRTR